MSAAILDRARAFAAIAEFLPESEREEIAKAIGDRIRQECTPARASSPDASPMAFVAAGPEHVDPRWKRVTDFLKGKGFEGADLVRATAGVAGFLDSGRFGHLTEDARLQTWWSLHREGKPE